MILPFGVTRDETSGNYRDITDEDIAGASQRAILSARVHATAQRERGSLRRYIDHFRQEYKAAFARELEILVE